MEADRSVKDSLPVWKDHVSKYHLQDAQIKVKVGAFHRQLQSQLQRLLNVLDCPVAKFSVQFTIKRNKRSLL